MTITETLVACIFCFIIGILMVGGMIKIGEIIIDCYNKHKTTKANLNRKNYNYNQININEDIIDEDYIKKYYDNNVVNTLRGQANNRDNKFAFFINRHDAMDIKLPYELLSPKLSVKHDDQLFTLNTEGYDYYRIILSVSDNDLNLRSSFGRDFSYKTNHNEIICSKLLSLSLYYDFTQDIEVDLNQILDSLAVSESSLVDFIQENNLKSQEIVDYYVRLIKLNQPSIDEIYEKLIKFEKAKKEMNRIREINKNEKVSQLVEDYKSKNTHKDQYDSIDRELISLLRSDKLS